MFKPLIRCAILLLLLPCSAISAGHALSREITLKAVHQAKWESVDGAVVSPQVIKVQVWLDRARASPGVIDGKLGENTRKAIAAFREMNDRPSDDDFDEQLWNALNDADNEPVLTRYVLTADDVEGPFIDRVPDDYREMSKLDRLSFTSVQEKLAEQFHMSEDLLRQLNPDTQFDKPGTELVVANITRGELPEKVTRLEIRNEQVRAFDNADQILAIYPATIGSDERPSPTGKFEVTAVAENPKYYYDPALKFQGVEVKEKLELPPGPNNPVGVVWMSLSAEGYGIHGTPHPELVGKRASHGCIRLTNWDALELATHLRKGTRVAIEVEASARK